MIQDVYVIQHAHTDIGYTHGQSRIVRWHEGFIHQAMAIAERRDDFAWTCETLYGVEQFWQRATPQQRSRFAELVRQGRIGLTGGYLHFNDLPDAPLLEALAQRVRRFADHGLPITAAMHADINGCPLAQARALARAGITFLMMNVHPHHGYVPLGRREAVFRWDLGDGQALTVLHADHYHTGNELGLAPGGECNYSAGFTDLPRPFDDDVLDRRLPAYLQRMQASGWTHDFAVLGVSGIQTDNSPPSELISDRIARWNHTHRTSGPHVQMVTLDRLASIIAQRAGSLPIHRGDWTDWWCDGAASLPQGVTLFRHAQRERRRLVAMGPPEPDEALDQALALFAEHTFGHSASISAPWNLLAQQLRLRKIGYAAQAADRAQEVVDQAAEELGAGPLSVDQPMRFIVHNVLDRPCRDLVELEMEYGESRRWNLDGAVRIVRGDNAAVLPHQPVSSLRGRRFLVELSLQPGAAVELSIEPDQPAPTPPNLHPILSDGARDVRENDADIPPTHLRTDHVEIAWTPGEGITRWKAIDAGADLLDAQAGILPFTLRASRLHAPMDGTAQCDVRRRLGRNRNAPEAQWSQSRLVRAAHGESGQHTRSVVLDYAMDGFELVRIKLDARTHQPRVDVEVILHKSSTWDIENVYLALPFSAGADSRLWLDRSFPLRPGIDQLPGTVLDYMGVHDGLGWTAPGRGVAVSQLDAHLVQLGPLEYGVRMMAGEQPPDWRPRCVYSWLMTNYWETNFAPELGGFYSFRYSIHWGSALSDPSAAFAHCRDANLPPRAFRLAGPQGKAAHGPPPASGTAAL